MTQPVKRLESSIPANNTKIIEIFNKLRSGQLSINSDYQRKLVWKKQHKFDFIDTILCNFPFPEVYLAPGSLDQEKLILVDEIVDGQQRLTTIRDYINGVDMFALPKIPIKRFSELDMLEKSSFLNYEVSIRYLKGVSQEQIKDIFQRINKTDYALNSTERLNAQWGESEFICFCKQLVETEFDSNAVQYIVQPESRETLLNFFHGDEDDDSIFSSGDKSRMLALQYIMTVVATIDYEEYFPRNDKINKYIQGFNDSFPQASVLEEKIVRVVKFIQSLKFERKSRWLKKANLFTLLVELSKFDISRIDTKEFLKYLERFDRRASLDEFGLGDQADALLPEEKKYLELAREAVNEKASRDFRGSFMHNVFQSCMNQQAQT
jgi:hypothetical protein